MKAVLVGPEFHNYNDSIAKAFEQEDIPTAVMPFKEQAFSTARQRYWKLQSEIESDISNPLRRGVRRVGRGVLFPDWSIQPEIPKLRVYGRKLIKTLEANKPEILVVIKGTSLLPETLRRLKKSLPSLTLILWAQDSVTRYPIVLSGIQLYDLVFVFEPSDVEFLTKRGVEARYLPMGFDPAIYRPLREAPKKKVWNAVFVGEGRPERCSALELLGKRLSSLDRRLNIGIFGDRWDQFERRLMDSSGDRISWAIHDCNCPPDDVNRIYNESEICLNLHHPQSKEGLNPRTFEIPGAGSLEIVDKRPALHSMFEEGKEIVSFDSFENLSSEIVSLLDDPGGRAKIADSGHQRAIKEHTFSHRVKEILSRL